MKFDFANNTWIDTGKNPDQLAYTASDGDFTLQQFYDQVQRLVAVLNRLNIPVGHPVIIYGHKEKMFPVAIAACFTLQLPYVPMDIIYPEERVQRVQKLCSSDIIIYTSDKKLNMDFAITIDKDLHCTVHNPPQFAVPDSHFPHDPTRYIIFTSGSTGEPKGVQITNSALCSWIKWLQEDHYFRPDDVFINQVPFSFDVSLYDIAYLLHFEGSVIYNDADTAMNANKFLQRISYYKGSVWISTPSFVYIYIREKNFNEGYLPSLHYFILAGEALPGNTVRKIRQQFARSKVVNSYGPTEATVTVTYVDVSTEMTEKYPTVPIGFVKRETEILIQNPDEGGVGEMLIVGDNVSIGYLRRPDLNAERFTTANGKRAYHTGDLGYYKDGLLFYIGRNDDQIKLNGYRIELDEIAEVMKNLHGVANAACIVLRVNGVPRKIIGFLCSTESIDKANLKTQLSTTLPHYMVPDDVMQVEQIPMNANGKTDRKLLEEWYLKR
ncbi:MAG: AMP-binding protein [Flavobacteriales bacterium]